MTNYKSINFSIQLEEGHDGAFDFCRFARSPKGPKGVTNLNLEHTRTLLSLWADFFLQQMVPKLVLSGVSVQQQGPSQARQQARTLLSTQTLLLLAVAWVCRKYYKWLC